ncbi:MAG: hypothetical protein H8E66_30535 [Planctomycetes bacterium]|nr:hypothetical protein [Planctomycetota bacterium]
MSHPLDTQDMQSIIRKSPAQLIAGLKTEPDRPLPAGPFDQIVVAGMGGSWMAAALVAEAGLSRVPLHILRSYDLPVNLNGTGTLMIASSFSGNTEETLSIYDAALQNGFPLVGISSGGHLEQRCRGDDIPFVRIPAAPAWIQPRSATGYGVGILVRLLARCGCAVDGAEDAVAALVAYLFDEMERTRERGRDLVDVLREATPVVYSPLAYETVARIWKIKFNENAKTPAFWNVFPELNHNEMTGWIHRHGRFHLVLLSDPQADPRLQDCERITIEILKPYGLESSSVSMNGRSRLEKIFSTLLVGEWASYELALMLGEDPSPVELVEEFKRRLRQAD